MSLKTAGRLEAEVDYLRDLLLKVRRQSFYSGYYSGYRDGRRDQHNGDNVLPPDPEEAYESLLKDKGEDDE